MEIRQSAEDYLESILVLSKKGGGKVFIEEVNEGEKL